MRRESVHAIELYSIRGLLQQVAEKVDIALAFEWRRVYRCDKRHGSNAGLRRSGFEWTLTARLEVAPFQIRFLRIVKSFCSRT